MPLALFFPSDAGTGSASAARCGGCRVVEPSPLCAASSSARFYGRLNSQRFKRYADESVGVFAAATALAGRLQPVALASHQIALNVASFVFMVPLGVSSAAAMLVGQAVGRRDPSGAARSGWKALGAIAVFTLLVASVFLLAPERLIGAFSRDAAVLELGARLPMVAGVFQLFDGLQVVATGVLRGLADTRSPMLWNYHRS